MKTSSKRGFGWVVFLDKQRLSHFVSIISNSNICFLSAGCSFLCNLYCWEYLWHLKSNKRWIILVKLLPTTWHNRSHFEIDWNENVYLKGFCLKNSQRRIHCLLFAHISSNDGKSDYIIVQHKFSMLELQALLGKKRRTDNISVDLKIDRLTLTPTVWPTPKSVCYCDISKDKSKRIKIIWNIV